MDEINGVLKANLELEATLETRVVPAASTGTGMATLKGGRSLAAR